MKELHEESIRETEHFSFLTHHFTCESSSVPGADARDQDEVDGEIPSSSPGHPSGQKAESVILYSVDVSHCLKTT